jgi:ATP-dependent RNA circularization protein (DNA/RNA ligase family)
MYKYHKINGLYKRYRGTPNKGKLILGEYSQPEFELLKDIKWLWTEKLDGSNHQIEIVTQPLMPVEGRITIRGRTEKSDINPKLKNKIQEMIGIDKAFDVFKVGENTPDVVIYGEGISHKIQSGGKYFKEGKGYNFVVFDINVNGVFLERETVEEICNELELPIVPVRGEGTIDDAIDYVKAGMKSNFGDFIAEGLVVRPKYELRNRRGRRIISKIKHKDFVDVQYL